MASTGQLDILQIKDLASSLSALDTAIDTHEARTDNPHAVTAAQVGAIATSAKGALNGVAALDANGKVPASQLPALALERLVVVADDAARFALTEAEVQEGDVVKQTDTLSSYIVTDSTELDNEAGYTLIGTAASAPVDSIFGRIGDIVATAGDYDSTQITNSSAVPGANVSAALNQLASDITALTPAYLYPVPSGTVNGANTDFVMRNSSNTANVAANPDETDLYLNNLWQEPGVDYTWQSANTIARFSTAPLAGWRVRSRGRTA